MTDKRIVYKSRIKFIFLLIISWGFVVTSICTGYTWGIVCFGLCAIVTTYPLIDPRWEFVFIGTSQYKEQINKKLNERLEDLEIFRYTENGFIVRLDRSNYDIKWAEIQTIFGYKVDLLTTDEIRLDIFCGNKISFSVTEKTPGWIVFLERIKEQFPTMEEDWDFNIQSPTFATNLSLIYDRENMTWQRATEVYYDQGKRENKKTKWW